MRRRPEVGVHRYRTRAQADETRATARSDDQDGADAELQEGAPVGRWSLRAHDPESRGHEDRRKRRWYSLGVRPTRALKSRLNDRGSSYPTCMVTSATFAVLDSKGPLADLHPHTSYVLSRRMSRRVTKTLREVAHASQPGLVVRDREEVFEPAQRRGHRRDRCDQRDPRDSQPETDP